MKVNNRHLLDNIHTIFSKKCFTFTFTITFTIFSYYVIYDNEGTFVMLNTKLLFFAFSGVQPFCT